MFTGLISTVQGGESSCLKIDKPARGEIISTPQCTLSVSICDKVDAIIFKIRYLTDDGESYETRSLGNITRPPYTLIWNASEIPNQLYKGATFMAEGRTRRGSAGEVRNDGVFFTHFPVKRRVIEVPYSEREKAREVEAVRLTSAETSAYVDASISWNENELFFYVNVLDRLFYTDLPKNKYAKLGVEILIDPGLSREPYPSERCWGFVIPLMGAPYRIIAKPEFAADGSINISESTRDCSYYARIKTEDFKGFSVESAVPWKEVFKGTMPDSLGCNIIVKALDKNSNIVDISLAEGNSIDEAHCPFIWATAVCAGKPMFANSFLLWLFTFFIGLALGASGTYVILSLKRKLSSVVKFERSEAEKELVNKIMTIIEAEITNKRLSIREISSRLSMHPKKIESIIRRYCGESFREHLMLSRIELAKERLRSSHSSETSIADLSGFSSVDEMEKYFKKYMRQTPYRFREENQVT